MKAGADGERATVVIDRITSRDNALLKDLRRLAQDNTAYRKSGRIWVEGDHLGRAALQRGWVPELVLAAEAAWPRWRDEFQSVAPRVVLVPDVLFEGLTTLESPVGLGFVLALPLQQALQPEAPTVLLDRVQDAGNVGSILRSAGAFGFRQVLALRGTAALWSPKVLRAGMGAHFGLRLVEGLDPVDLQALKVPRLLTSSHQGDWLHRARLPWPCAWVLGHEGQGVRPELNDTASAWVRIAQPGGEESLNVAAAAAICLHASASAAGAAP